MNYTEKELREEEKRNIEIINQYNEQINEIEENINSINSIIDLINKQGELNKQIETIKGQLNALEKVDNLFDNSNDNEKKALLEKKERLSELKTLLVLNQNGNESDIQMLERKKEELENKKVTIENKKNDAVDLMKNIVEICNENIETLEHEINGKKKIQMHKSSAFEEIFSKYAELEEELSKYEKYNGFLTRKQQLRIGNIEIEKKELEEKLTQVMPNLNKEFINKAKAAEIDAQFEAMELKEGRAINRKNTLMTSYKKIIEEINKYLEENIKENKNEQEKNNEKEEQPVEKIISEEEKQQEQPESIVTKDIPLQYNALNDNSLNETYMIRDNKNAKKTKQSKITNENWNKDELEEFNLFFEDKKDDSNEQKTEENSEEINSNKGTDEIIKQNEEELNTMDESYQDDVSEFTKLFKKEETEENKTVYETNKEELETDDYFKEYIKGLREEAEILEIDKKIKRKVEKEKKQGRIKRTFEKIKNYFFGDKIDDMSNMGDMVNESELTDEIKEKSGRTK